MLLLCGGAKTAIVKAGGTNLEPPGGQLGGQILTTVNGKKIKFGKFLGSLTLLVLQKSKF